MSTSSAVTTSAGNLYTRPSHDTSKARRKTLQDYMMKVFVRFHSLLYGGRRIPRHVTDAEIMSWTPGLFAIASVFPLDEDEMPCLAGFEQSSVLSPLTIVGLFASLLFYRHVWQDSDDLLVRSLEILPQVIMSSANSSEVAFVVIGRA